MNIIKDPLKNLKNIGIKLSDFEEIKTGNQKYTILRKDSFSYVEKMKSKKNNRIFAIKKIDINSHQFNIKDFQREKEIMFMLNHENIIKFYGYFQDKENINKYKEIYKDKKNKNYLDELKGDISIYCLVLEYTGNDSLKKFHNNKIENRDKNLVPVEQKDIINILKKLLTGLKYLHDKGIMHRDITPDNILLDENNNVKISNFGISAILKDYKTKNKKLNENLFSTNTIVGRIDYSSPEIQRGEKYDYSCDIYSLGLTILYLMSYENPIIITKNSLGEKTRHVKTENIHKSYIFYLQKLILRMVNDNPNLRPKASEAYDELEVIEIFMQKPNNKILQKCLDDLNNNNNYKPDIKYKEKNKKFYKLITDMKIINKSNIKEEYGFSSSNNINSQPIQNSQPYQPYQPYQSNEPYQQNQPYQPNQSNQQNQPYQPYQPNQPNQPYQPNQPNLTNQTFSAIPQIQYNNNYPNNNSFNSNNYAEQNNKNNFYYTQNNFYNDRRMPSFQTPVVTPPYSDAGNYMNKEKENEKDKNNFNLGKNNYI